jgi:hypothetical protein
MHVVLVLLVLVEFRNRGTTEQPAARDTAAQREVQMVYLPPPPQPKPPPSQEQPPAAPLTPGSDQTPGSTARQTPTPEKDPNAPPDAKRSTATAPESQTPPDGGGAQKTTEPPLKAFAPTPAPEETPAIESEAQRIFGHPLTDVGPVSGTEESRPWESPLNWRSNGCTSPQVDSTAPPGMGVVQGRVYREDTHIPLPGAHLQILGTPYYTYSNDYGEFRLVFDRSLVDNCRTQSVRVWAPGYRARDLILYVGTATNSDVNLQRGR